jgi:hypothetical protein
VQIRDYNGNWYDVQGSPTSGTWIKVCNLYSCKGYEWRVRANCSYGSSSYWSKAKSFSTTCGNSCGAPQWVYTNGISSNSGSLHWATVNGADYYVVEWRIPGGQWYAIPGPISNNFVDLTGLAPGTSYEWHVKAHCLAGYFSDWSSLTYFNTLGNTCGLPFFRYTLPITDSTATFNWSSVAGALNYTIQIRTGGGAWVDVNGSPTTDTSITVTGLLPNTLYEWQMRVNCTNGALQQLVICH